MSIQDIVGSYFKDGHLAPSGNYVMALAKVLTEDPRPLGLPVVRTGSHMKPGARRTRMETHASRTKAGCDV